MCPDPDPRLDAVLDEAAALRGGALTAAHLRALGVTDGRRRSLVRLHDLVRLRRGVLAPSSPRPYDNRASARRSYVLRDVAAACLAAAGSVASHETAAWLHRLELLRWVTGPIVVTVTKRPGATPDALGGVVQQVSRLPPEHVTRIDGVPVTTLARTCADLARTRELRDGLVVMDSGLRRGVDPADLAEVLEAQRGWPGTRSARAALRLADVRRESPLESFGAAVWAERGLPPSIPQVWVYDGEGLVGRVDEMWPDQQTVGEADGMLKYADQGVLMAEKRRHERLVNAGLEVVRYTWDDLWKRPVETAERATAAFARGPLLPPLFLASPTRLSFEGWRGAWYARYGRIPQGDARRFAR